MSEQTQKLQMDEVEQIAPTTERVVGDGKIGLSERDIRHNMIFVIMLDSIFAMGATDISVALAPMWVYLGASNSLIGFIQGLGVLGMVSVALIPFISRKFRYKKWLLFSVQIPYVGAWGLIGLALILGPRFGIEKDCLLTICAVAIVAQAFFYGFTGVPHQEYVAACIPMSHRGRFTGYSFAIGAVFGLGVAFVGKLVLDRFEQPMSIGVLFLLSWFICQFGYIFALFGREVPVPKEKVPIPWSRQMMAAAWKDKEYLWFIVIWDLYLAFYWPMLFTFLPIQGIRDFGMALSLGAVFMIIRHVVSIAGAPVLGYLTDRYSAKKMFFFWSFAAVLTFVPLLVTKNSLGVYAAMSAGAIVVAGLCTAGNTLIYGIPKAENRSGYYSLQLLVQSVSVTIGPMLLGRMLDIGFTHAIVGVTIFLAVLSLTSVTKLAGLSENPADYG